MYKVAIIKQKLQLQHCRSSPKIYICKKKKKTQNPPKKNHKVT